MKFQIFATSAFALIAGAAFADGDGVSKSDVLTNYANTAHAKYEDSLITARVLGDVIDAWIAARVPYQQTEVYRFGNGAVNDGEGKVNAWPLDEGLIDYVGMA